MRVGILNFGTRNINSNLGVIMEYDESTKLLILPKGYTSFDILELPYGDLSKKILATEDQLFELREVHGSSQHDTHPEPELPSGGAVKSVIIELADSSEGGVLKSPRLVTCTPFNIVFYVLNMMHNLKEVYMSRFHTLDDILENFKLHISNNTLRSKLEASMEIVCTSIEENNELFFKLSMEKSFEFLSRKIELLKSLILSSSEFAVVGVIKGSLRQSNSVDEPPAQIEELQTIKYSIDIIFGSYLSEDLKSEYLEFAKIDFSPLIEYLEKQQANIRALAAIDDNMEQVVQTTKKSKKVRQQASNVKTTKKVVKKVAVGKGALDSFFKRS